MGIDDKFESKNKYFLNYISKMQTKYNPDLNVLNYYMNELFISRHSIYKVTDKYKNILPKHHYGVKENLLLEWAATDPKYNYSDYITVRYSLCEAIMAKLRIQLWINKLLQNEIDDDYLNIEI